MESFASEELKIESVSMEWVERQAVELIIHYQGKLRNKGIEQIQKRGKGGTWSSVQREGRGETQIIQEEV